MKRIDQYVNNIYKGFDESDEETQILIEETKSHLYDEVDDLKNQGFTKEESIKKAILNFGKEKSVIKEMKGILKRQDKFSKILLKIGLVMYFIAIIFKFVGWGYNFLDIGNKQWSEYEKNKNSSVYVFNSIGEKLNDKESIDENSKKKIDEILDQFNERTNNGWYNVSIEKDGKCFYEYSKELSSGEVEDDEDQDAGVLENGWTINYKRTKTQHFFDDSNTDKIFGEVNITTTINSIGSYLIVLSWIIASISFLYKSYINSRIKIIHILYYFLTSFMIIGLLAVGFRSFELAVVFIVGILFLISIFYIKKYLDKDEKKIKLN